MLALETGGEPESGARILVLPDAAPAGMVWVRVTLDGAPKASLAGLIPADAARRRQ